MDLLEDNYYMKIALTMAKKAFELKEVPVGAIIVYGDRVIGKGFNQKENLQLATRHAEIMAIEEASKFLGSWRLNGCKLYVTLEPCIMCAGAIIHSRIDEVIIATKDYKTGACGSLYNLVENNNLNHRANVKFGVLEEEASKLLKNFFKLVRSGKIEKPR